MSPVRRGAGTGQHFLRPDSAERLKAILLLTAFAFATRVWIFGNPVINIDEQFYLLAGDRLLQGELPYVDIWDRKPIGLFLIYALVCRVFADPVIGYQLLAAISVALTSYLLFAIARRLTSFTVALGGAAAYLAWLSVFGGIGGQAPVFYNLPMAAAAALTIAVVARPDDHHLTRRGCAIMLLTGLAIQIKYTAVFEGVFFGLTLLWAGKTRDRALPRLGADAAVWIACALAPTLAAAGAYFAMGHLDAFVQANFVSVFEDKGSSLHELANLAGLVVGLTPFLVCARIALRRWRTGKETGHREARWMLAWAGASFAGFLVYGGWADHYVLPMLLPLSLVTALAFDSIAKQRRAIALVVGLGLLGGFGRAIVEERLNGNRQEVSRLTAVIRPYLGNGCLYVYEGLPILYLLTHSCLPTRYVFPEHLTEDTYEHALGVDQLGELRGILTQRPSVVVKSTVPDDDTRPASRELLESGLRQDYRIVGQAIVGATRYEVYALTNS